MCTLLLRSAPGLVPPTLECGVRACLCRAPRRGKRQQNATLLAAVPPLWLHARSRCARSYIMGSGLAVLTTLFSWGGTLTGPAGYGEFEHTCVRACMHACACTGTCCSCQRHMVQLCTMWRWILLRTSRAMHASAQVPRRVLSGSGVWAVQTVQARRQAGI